VNTLSFIGKGLRFRPQRTVFLLLGFAVGVMVMTVLLSVGTAVLTQAMDEDLTGGGEVVLLPVGIDVAVLKTGGVTAMNFDIPNARYLTREFLNSRRLPGVATVSPELSRVYGTLMHDGHTQLVRMEGVIPSRFRELWPAMTASFQDGPGDRDYIDPDFTALLYDIDRFHPPVVDSTQVWAEWHYFNYHDDAGRSLYVSIRGLRLTATAHRVATRAASCCSSWWNRAGGKPELSTSSPAARLPPRTTPPTWSSASMPCAWRAAYTACPLRWPIPWRDPSP
jgi:hypothetical protein